MHSRGPAVETAHDVGETLMKINGSNAKGIGKDRLYLIPSSMKPGEIARVLREGYDVGMLNDGFHNLIEALKLDVLMIDTHPGLNEETLLSIAVSDALAIIMLSGGFPVDDPRSQDAFEAVFGMYLALTALYLSDADPSMGDSDHP